MQYASKSAPTKSQNARHFLVVRGVKSNVVAVLGLPCLFNTPLLLADVFRNFMASVFSFADSTVAPFGKQKVNGPHLGVLTFGGTTAPFLHVPLWRH